MKTALLAGYSNHYVSGAGKGKVHAIDVVDPDHYTSYPALCGREAEPASFSNHVKSGFQQFSWYAPEVKCRRCALKVLYRRWEREGVKP